MTDAGFGSFASADDVRKTLAEVDYIVDDDLATVVLLATRLDRPLLLEGPAGVGKTELAKGLAASTGRRLVRLQCYEGLDDGRALYEWDYGRQLLHVQMLRDRIGALVADAPDLPAAAEILRRQDTGLYTEHFLSVRPCSSRSCPTIRWCCSSTRSTAPRSRWRRCCSRSSPKVR